MTKLFGAQRMIFQAILDLPKDAAGYVADKQIEQRTNIALRDIKDWIETLDGEGFVEVARTTEGVSAPITAKGRLQLALLEPIPTTHGTLTVPEVTLSVHAPPSATSPATAGETETRPVST